MLEPDRLHASSIALRPSAASARSSARPSGQPAALSDVRHSVAKLAGGSTIDAASRSTIDPALLSRPRETLAQHLVAASLGSVFQVVNSMTLAVLLRDPSWPDDSIAVLFRHVCYGFVLTQICTTALSEMPGVMAPSGFENVATLILIRSAVVKGMHGQKWEAQMVTVVACSAITTFISSALLLLGTMQQFAELLGWIPDKIRHGLFAGIGFNIFVLGLDNFELSLNEPEHLVLPMNLLKWVPAYTVGMLVWFLDQKRPSRWLLLQFVTLVVVGTHICIWASGTTLRQAAEAKFLVGDMQRTYFHEYFVATYGNLGSVDWGQVVDNLPTMLTAAIIGPLLNVSINVLVLDDLYKSQGYDLKLDFAREFWSQAVGAVATGLGFGYNAYFAVSDTSLMQKAGGNTGRPVLIMCFMLVFFCAVPDILPVLTLLIPKLLPASLVVYVGTAIYMGCLQDMGAELSPSEYSFGLLTAALCVMSGPLAALVVCCVAAFSEHRMTISKDHVTERFSLARFHSATTMPQAVEMSDAGLEDPLKAPPPTAQPPA